LKIIWQNTKQKYLVFCYFYLVCTMVRYDCRSGTATGDVPHLRNTLRRMVSRVGRNRAVKGTGWYEGRMVTA